MSNALQVQKRFCDPLTLVLRLDVFVDVTLMFVKPSGDTRIKFIIAGITAFTKINTRNASRLTLSPRIARDTRHLASDQSTYQRIATTDPAAIAFAIKLLIQCHMTRLR